MAPSVSWRSLFASVPERTAAAAYTNTARYVTRPIAPLIAGVALRGSLGVPFVMRDVTLWAFTVPFFEQRTAELEEFEIAMRYMDQPVHAYLAQLAVIQAHDTASRLGEITTPSLVLAGEEDILIPVALSRRIHEGIPGSQWATTKGGHGCIWEHPAEFNRTYLDFVARYRKG